MQKYIVASSNIIVTSAGIDSSLIPRLASITRITLHHPQAVRSLSVSCAPGEPPSESSFQRSCIKARFELQTNELCEKHPNHHDAFCPRLKIHTKNLSQTNFTKTHPYACVVTVAAAISCFCSIPMNLSGAQKLSHIAVLRQQPTRQMPATWLSQCCSWW